MCITALRPCYHPCDEWLRAERSQRWLLRGLPTGSTAAPRQGMFSSLTSVAALLTAIATLLLVLEMRRQRKALYKRQFVCEDAQFVARPSDGFPLGLHLSRPGSDGEAKSRSQLRVRCTNIGPGPAKRVEYEWSYDPQQIIESVGGYRGQCGRDLARRTATSNRYGRHPREDSSQSAWAEQWDQSRRSTPVAPTDSMTLHIPASLC